MKWNLEVDPDIDDRYAIALISPMKSEKNHDLSGDVSCIPIIVLSGLVLGIFFYS